MRPPTESIQFRSFPARFLFFTVLVRLLLLLALVAAVVASITASGCSGGGASASGGRATTDPLNPFKPVHPKDYEPPIAARSAADPILPERLSETGLFLDTPALEPVPDLRPVPDDQFARWIGTTPQRAWTLATDPGDPALSTPGTTLVLHMEAAHESAGEDTPATWVLLRTEAGWIRYTYLWNKSGNDASLLPPDVR